MANTIINNTPFYIQGDGVSLTAAINLGGAPASVTFVDAFNVATGADVASNVVSVILAGSTINVTFSATFLYVVGLLINVSPIGNTFFPATQPVSGTVAVSSVAGSVAVTGTFWQTTQPVSVASMPTTPVTGTFWQTTQPVSGTIAVSNFPATQPISGTIAATQSGTWNIGTLTSITNPVTVAQATAANLNATVAGTGTFAVQASITTLGQQLAAASVPIVLTAAQIATLTPPSTITANAGTNLNTSALALDTSVNGLLVAQGSTTSGQKGSLILGAVTTAAPSYTTAQTSPLSLTPAGNLRVDGSTVTQPVSGTIAVSSVAGSVAVTGTFFQTTQPVSIASMPTTPVTGTFWQATQPVSGTFWQTTQPVSGAVAATQSGGWNIGTLTSITNPVAVTGTFWPTTQPVSGTFWQTTQPVSGTVTAAQATAANLNATVSIAAAQTLATVTTVSAVTAITNALPTGANTIGKIELLGNTGATLDAAIGGAAPTNSLWETSAPATGAAAACTPVFINASGAARSVKASAGNLYGFSLTNNTAGATVFVEFFNTASAPVLGTTAVLFSIPIANGANLTIMGPGCALANFSTGIGFAVTTTENGTTTAAVTGALFYL